MIDDISVEDLAYVAGIVDGEGSISIYTVRNQFYSKVSVANTDDILMNWLVERFGGGITHHQFKNSWKPLFTWQIYSQQAAEFLRLILPFLKLKWQQAEILIELENMKSTNYRFRPLTGAEYDKRNALREAARILNHRGTSEN